MIYTKKLVSLLFSLVLILSLAAPAAAVNETREKTITYRGISVTVDGVETVPRNERGESVEPFIMEGSTYLPLRAVAEALGLEVEWIAAENTVALASGAERSPGSGTPSASHGSKSALLTFRNIKVSLNGRTLCLLNEQGETVEPFIIDGSTYVPLRAVASALDLEVKWLAQASTVVIEQAAYKVEREIVRAARDRQGANIISLTETDTLIFSDRTKTRVFTDGSFTGETLELRDGGGRPLKRIVSDKSGAVVYVESYTYGEDGLLQSLVRDEAGTNEGDFYISFSYRDGRLYKTKQFDNDIIPRIHSTDTTHTYDEAGNLIKKYIHLPMGSWEEIVYTYDESGLLTSESSVAYDILGGGFSKYSVSYFYDADGLLLRSEDSAGGVTEYYYNADGTLINSVAERCDGIFLLCSYQ